MSAEQSEEQFKIIVQTISKEKPQTVEQLVALLKERLPLTTEEEVMETVLQLKSKGKISIGRSPQPVSSNLGSYLRSGQALWYWLTVATVTLSAVAVFTIPAELYPWGFIRQVLGALLVLWFPGYSLTKALLLNHALAEGSSETVKTIARICLSLCMSLAIVSVIGLLLNYTPLGVSLNSVTLSLLGFTVVFAIIAILREHRAKT